MFNILTYLDLKSTFLSLLVARNNKPSFLSEMDIPVVTHYPEIDIITFLELKSAFLSLLVASLSRLFA